eukprot:2074829-Rhodomonas_salina.2
MDRARVRYRIEVEGLEHAVHSHVPPATPEVVESRGCANRPMFRLGMQQRCWRLCGMELRWLCLACGVLGSGFC